MAFKTFTAGSVLTAAEVNDYLMKQAVIVCTSATRPSSPNEGMLIYETDTNKVMVYSGTDWAPRDAGGILGIASVTASQTGIGATETDLTGLTTTVTVGAGRRVKVTASLAVDMDTISAVGQVRIKQDGTEVQYLPVFQPAVASQSLPYQRSVVLSPSAGSHTYKLTAARTSGSGTLAIRAFSTDPAFILVEDIGAA